MKDCTVVLCVGHSRFINGRRDGGAVSAGGVSEWQYNSELAQRIGDLLERKGATVHIVDEYIGESYGAAMRFASEQVKALGGDLALELHFNAANGRARGHEWLHMKWADKSALLAAHIDNKFKKDLPELKNRGLQSIVRGGRGYWFLRLTPCPAVICEPFFGDNALDWQIAVDRKRAIANAIANGCADWWGEQRGH